MILFCLTHSGAMASCCIRDPTNGAVHRTWRYTVAEQYNCWLKLSARQIMSSVLSVLTEIWSWITWCWTLKDTLRLQTLACVRRTCLRAWQHARSVEHRITSPQRWGDGEGWHSTDPDKPKPQYSHMKIAKVTLYTNFICLWKQQDLPPKHKMFFR